MNKKFVMKPLLAALLLTLPALAVQAATPVVPSAGMILQEVQPVKPLLPSSVGTGLTIQQEDGAKLPPSAPFMVKVFRISGNTLFDTATLQALIADGQGQSLSLVQISALAERITDYYHSHDYPLARAIIPAQVIQGGVVNIEIIEAHYGKINLNNTSLVIDSLLAATLAPLQSGHSIGQAEMDHALLLLSDVPGVVVAAVLKPGEAVGSADLLVNTTPGPTSSGNVVLDGYGNRYTGRERIGGTVTFINPLHHGDTFTANGLSSGSGMNYGRFAYESLLNGMGTRMGGAYSALHYILGESAAALDAHGTAQVESLWAKHTLVRSRDINTYGQIQYDGLKLRDHIDATTPPRRTDRHLDNWTASLTGDDRDTVLAGGVSAWNLSWTVGRVTFDDAQAQSDDAAAAKTEGRFSKWNASLARLQGLSDKNTLYLAFSGQWANNNLDSSQKTTAGGPYTVRAYDMGAVSGDSGYLLTIEFRRDLGMTWGGQWQAVAFVDSAGVKVNQTPWATGPNEATLNGIGFGLNWAGPDQWTARVYLATPVGSSPALVGLTNATRTWVEVSKRF
ncbi:MAG TPA: ShlB/FhaC/HecB family hemolysin secretion/activation protein [Rhodoferax sp.]